MIYLLLSIACSASLILLFKELGKHKVHLFSTITWNYIVCVVIGLIESPGFYQTLTRNHENDHWINVGILQGIFFISIFYLIGTASQKVGVGYTALVTRISVVIPTLASVFVFQEKLITLQWVGIVIAFLSLILFHFQFFLKKDKSSSTVPIKIVLILGLVLFLGTGTTDFIFKWFNEVHSGEIDNKYFIIIIFGIAGGIGLIINFIQLLLKKTKNKLSFKSIGWGIAIGVPNYFSIVFLLEALQHIPGAVFYPTNNIGILLAINLIGKFFYKESIHLYSWIGLILASIAIIINIIGNQV